MKKKLCVVSCVLFMFLTSISQNLVPNYSFENFDTCQDNVNYAVPWNNPTWASPDYFNQCSVPGYIGVPLNFVGYQYARTGVAYVGMCVYGSITGISVREYVQVQLLDTLIAGNHYCVNFYVSNARSSASFPSYSVAITKFGLYFSNNAITNTTGSTLYYVPQITSPDSVFLNDTLNWMQVSGTYIASGGEKYITLGNFSDDANTDTIQYYTTSTQRGAYYYLDDVSVVDCIGDGVDELGNDKNFKLYPNPNDGNMTLEYIMGDNETGILSIYDVMGKLIGSCTFYGNNKNLIIDKTQLNSGVYFYEIKINERKVKRDKLIIIK